MRILHYLHMTMQAEETLMLQLSRLGGHIGSSIEQHIVTTDNTASIPTKNLFIHYLSGIGHHTFISSFSIKRLYFQILSEVLPDIVHVHGAWDYSIYQIIQYSRQKGFIVVYSPDKGLEPSIISIDFWKKKLPRLIAYQFRAVRKADALLAVSATERKHLEELGWNRRIGHLRLSISPEETNTPQLYSQYLAFYTRVLNSNIRRFMTLNAWDAFTALLYAGCRQSDAPNMLSTEYLSRLHSLHSQEWNCLQVFAAAEGVSGQIVRGVEMLRLQMPALAPSVLAVLPSSTYRPLFPTGSPVKEDTLCEALASTKKMVENKKLKFAHLSELYIALRYTEYDEDKLMALLHRHRLINFTAGLLQILYEYILLEEGYMPLPPSHNRHADIIRKCLTKTNKYYETSL